MSEDRWRIELDNTIGEEEAQQIRTKLADRREIVVRSAKRTLGLGPEVLSIIPLAALVISTANLTLALMKYADENNKEKRIDLELFKKTMATELAKLGLLDWKLEALDNFAAITEITSDPCYLVIATGSGERVKLSVRREGSTLRFSRTA
jgi:hypothetical protein